MPRLILTIPLALFASSCFAAITPVSQGYDSRVQQVTYNPKNVIKISTKIGRSTLIQLEKGESILNKELSGVAMGDTAAWGLAVRGNNIMLKPIAEHPETNLLIVSDKNRTYSFDLVSAKRNRDVSYVVKLLYPEQNKNRYKPSKKFVLPCSDGDKNFRYGMWGDTSLAPAYAWDDGRFTCFKFKKNIEQPVLYKIGSDGKETLVNFNMVNDILVAHSIANEFRFRLGDSVLGVKSFGLNPQGFNFKATTLKDTTREVIDNDNE